MVWPPRKLKKPGAPVGMMTQGMNARPNMLPPNQRPGHAAFKPPVATATGQQVMPWSPDTAAGPGARSPVMSTPATTNSGPVYGSPGGGMQLTNWPEMQQPGGGMPAPIYAPGTNLYNPNQWSRLRQMPDTFTGMYDIQHMGPGTNFWNADTNQMWRSGGGVAGLDMNNLGPGWSTNAPTGFINRGGTGLGSPSVLPEFADLRKTIQPVPSPRWRDTNTGEPSHPKEPWFNTPRTGEYRIPEWREQPPPWQGDYPTNAPRPGEPPWAGNEKLQEWLRRQKGGYPRPRPGPIWQRPDIERLNDPYGQNRTVADNWQDIFGGAVPLRHMGNYADEHGYKSPIRWNEAREYPIMNLEAQAGRQASDQGHGMANIMHQPGGNQTWSRPAYGDLRINAAERPAYEAFARYLHSQQQQGFNDFDWGGGGMPWQQQTQQPIFRSGGGTIPGTMPGAGSQSPPTVPPWMENPVPDHTPRPLPGHAWGGAPAPWRGPGGWGRHDFSPAIGAPGPMGFRTGGRPVAGGNRPQGWGPG